jgi:hypothetical protein
LLELNVAAVTQGAAVIWNSHFRVGAGKGTDLDLDHCPKFSQNDECIAASLMFRLTAQASGYFEHVWARLTDYNDDATIFDPPDSSITQIGVLDARGIN